MRLSLYTLSALVYVLLFFALIWFFLEDASVMNESKKASSFSQKTTDNKNTKTIPSSKIIVPKKREKEVDLIHIDFAKRLHQMDAKIGDPVFVRIFKKEHMLEVWIKPKDEYQLFKKYPICAFSGKLGPKLKEGDRQAPEGFYKVKKHLLNPKSKYHLSFNLGYPNTYDKAHKRTGTYLMVHGECVSVGCYAMTNAKIEEIYKLVENALKKGQKYVQVHAFPFEMDEENMSMHENNKWYNFWTELKKGYDYFESEKLPPLIKVNNKHYTIHEANE